jgi:predicted Zn-dependent protease
MQQVTRRRALADMISVAGIAACAGCAVNPATGKREFMLVSEQEEIAMGKKAHPQILGAYGVYDDALIRKYLDSLGQEIVKVTPRRNLQFTFTVLDSPVVNAFAIPGGYVYFNRGLMAYFNDEAQFAGVLGHEIGHVVARHSARQMSKAELANLGLQIGGIFSPTVQQYSDLLSAGASLMFLKFSRDDERQADKLGVDYSSQVGYDAREMSRFFHTFELLAPKGNAGLPAWQSTHPDPGDRIQATAREAQKIQTTAPDKRYIVQRNEYLDRMDGLVFGDNPKNGYVKNGIFYHPVLKFFFPVPADWGVANQPEEVRMSPADQRAALLLTIESGSTPRDASEKFVQQNKETLTESGAADFNGLGGYKTLGSIPSDPPCTVRSYFIQMDTRVFAFHGITATSDAASFEEMFRRTASGFRRLSDPAFINVPVKKIEVRAVKGTKTLRAACSEFGVPGDAINDLAVVNGMDLDDTVQAGTRIKIVS